MISRIIVTLACIGIMLGSALLSAQDASTEADQQSTGQSVTPPQQEDAPARESENSSDDPTPSRDPSEYQSSEQISEDLSVSFPVDI